MTTTPITQERQDLIERVILRRLHENRIDGFTLEMAKEIASLSSPQHPPETSALLAEAEEAIAAGAMLHTWPWPKITGLIGDLAQALRESRG